MDFNVSLAIWGAVTIALVMIVILKKWLSPVIALSFFPFVTAVMAGFNMEDIGSFANNGIKAVAPTGVMFIFSVLFFGIMYDNGLFEQPIRLLLKTIKGNPIMIFLGLYFISILSHLDGAGATTFLIAISTFKPIFDRLNLDRRKMICVVALAAATMNNLPWGGPTLRMATVLKREDDAISLLFHPSIPAMIAGLIVAGIVVYFIGKSEINRITGKDLVNYQALETTNNNTYVESTTKNALNIILVVISLVVLLAGWLPPFLVFALALSLCLPINYGFNFSKHKEAIDRHAKSAILMSSILFAAGIFTGIVDKSNMISNMSIAVANIIPQSFGQFFGYITGILGLTVGIATSPDSFYFGIMPVMVGVGERFGLDPAMLGRVALIARNAIWPVSPLSAAVYLLIGLGEVDLGDHIRYSYKYLLIPGIISLIVLFMTT